MFKWLFGKRNEVTVPGGGETSPSLSVSAERVEVSMTDAAAPVRSPESSPVVTSCGETAVKLVESNRAAARKLRSVLCDAEDEPPRVGADAVIVTPSKQQAAKVVRVQAGGRRVVAALGNARAARVYLRRPDGTYRPEGAPPQIASRLVIGGSV